jgi:hypothetical protein
MEVSRRKAPPEIGVTNQPGQKKTPVKVRQSENFSTFENFPLKAEIHH